MDIKAIEKLAKLIKSYKSPPRIVFLNGAGISTSCGIPDFRSPGTGLYDNLSKLDLPFAEAVFDIDYFQENPTPFYVLAKDIYPGQYQPSKFHFFIRHCQDKGLLKRCYTQNIDTLERLTGLDHDKIIEAHGSFKGNHCVSCGEAMSVTEMARHIMSQEIAKCGKCKGFVKPDIVFFGEALPQIFWDQWDEDCDEIDILVVCGTSLQVYPFAGLPTEVGPEVKRVLINKEAVGDFDERPRKDDIVILGDIEEIVAKLVEALDWRDEFDELIEVNDKLFKEKKLTLSVGDITKDIEEGLKDSHLEAKPEPKIKDEDTGDKLHDLEKDLSALKLDAQDKIDNK